MASGSETLLTISSALRLCPECGTTLTLDVTEAFELRLSCGSLLSHGTFVVKGQPGNWRIEYILEE